MRTDNPPALFEARGEVYMTRADFAKLNEKLVLIGGAFGQNLLDAKGGLNSLDYSGFGAPVTVDLHAKTATGIGTTWASIQAGSTSSAPRASGDCGRASGISVQPSTTASQP